MAADRTKLPKWAQKEIELLEMRLREARHEAQENLALAGLQKGRYGDLIAPTKTRLFFSDDDQGGISVMYDRGVLQVMSGGYGLSVRPRASNVVTVVQDS